MHAGRHGSTTGNGPRHLRKRHLGRQSPAAAPPGIPRLLNGAPPGERVINHQNHDGSDHRHKHAVEIDTAHTLGAE